MVHDPELIDLGPTPTRGRGERGVSLLLVAFSMVAVLGVAAIVVDLGNARQVRREVQAAVDAGALAGARELPIASNNITTRITKQSQARNRAMEYVTANLVGDSATPPTCLDTTSYTCSGTVDGVAITVTTPWDPTTDSVPSGAASAPYIAQMGFIHVEACEDTATFFAGALQQKSPRVCRQAVGRYTQVGGGFDFGLVATDPSKCGALTFAGNSETQLTSNGAVMVNSSCRSGSTQALDGNGSSWHLQFVDDTNTPVTGYIGVVGGASLNPCDPETQTTSCTDTIPTTGISPFGDPLGGLVAPTKPSGTAKSCPQNGGGALTAGWFQNCKITNGDISMQPGIYWMDGGFEMNGGFLKCQDGGGLTCSGTGILIYLNTGVLKLNGNGEVYLPPYQQTCDAYYTGTCYDGLSVWQKSSSEASLNGTDSFSIGTVYVPNGNLKANGNGGGSEINVTGIVVAKTVEISGTFSFNIFVPTDAPDPQTSVDLGLED